MKTVKMLIWCLAQYLGVMLSLLAFFVWAPWIGALSHAQAVAQYGAGKVPDCDAISVNHGQFICEPWGTTSSNPWGFALCTAIVVSGVGFVAYTRATGKGLFSTAFCEAKGSRVNAIRARFGRPDLEPSRVQSLAFFCLAVSAIVTVLLVSMLV
jgi:hypothetical protein